MAERMHATVVEANASHVAMSYIGPIWSRATCVLAFTASPLAGLHRTWTSRVWRTEKLDEAGEGEVARRRHAESPGQRSCMRRRSRCGNEGRVQHAERPRGQPAHRPRHRAHDQNLSNPR